MTKHRLLTFSLAMVSIILLGTGSIFAQNGKIAEMDNSGSSISFRILVPYESATLTVQSPNGKTFKKEFPVGTIPTFSPVTERANFYGEGNFIYELIIAPVLSDSVKQAQQKARERDTSEDVAIDLRKRGLLPAPLIQTGGFLVRNAQIISGDGTTDTNDNSVNSKNSATTEKTGDGEPLPEQSFPNQDVLIDGSLCVGVDCNLAGENFGADTIRLKENNLRIHFDDTSNSASFPFNDWRITINGQQNGDPSFFSIDDATAGTVPFRIAAGAGNNALSINSSGNVGLGTMTPVLELHIADGDTPSIRLEQNNSNGFTAQTWDIAANETNFFIRDVTNSSNLPFRIKPGAEGSTIGIGLGGRVGIGFNSNSSNGFPSDSGPKFEIRHSGSQILRVEDTGKLVTQSSVEIETGGLIFPDGTTQFTAATGGGGGTGSFLGANFATTFVAGTGSLDPSTASSAVITDGRVTNPAGAARTITLRFGLPGTANLANSAGTKIIYVIRYRDSDGTGTAARVKVDLIATNVNTGGVSIDTILNSQTNAATGLTTVTVCKDADFRYAFANQGPWLKVQLANLNATGESELNSIQVYRATACP